MQTLGFPLAELEFFAFLFLPFSYPFLAFSYHFPPIRDYLLHMLWAFWQESAAYQQNQ